MSTGYAYVAGPAGRALLQAQRFSPITPAELAAANSGQRVDLLAHSYRVFQLTTDPSLLYKSNGTALVLLEDAAAQQTAGSNVSPVFMVNATRTLVDASGAPISAGGDSYQEYPTFDSLPASPDGTTVIVLAASGVPFINRKQAGLYRRVSSAWVYLGSVPEGYFTDNVLAFFDDADPSKQLRLELSGISPGATRTLSAPDKSGTLATLDDVAPGPQGPQGIQGPPGPAGATGPQGPQGVQGLQGPTGATGPAGADGAQGPQGIQGNPGPSGDDGAQGPAGPANTLAIGTVSTGSAGSSAAASVTGASPSQTLNLTIPRGDQGVQGPEGPTGGTGPAGPANSLSIGTVVASAPGSAAAASITGTSPNQTLNLTLPRGDAGPTGATGAAGASGLGTAVALASTQAFSTTTLAAVPGMTLTLLANTTYVVRLYGAFTSAATTTGMAVALDIPSGTVFGYARHPVSATALGSCEQIADAATTGATAGVRAATTNVPLIGEWLVAVGATGGTLALMCRSEVSASAVTLQPGLRMFALAV